MTLLYNIEVTKTPLPAASEVGTLVRQKKLIKVLTTKALSFASVYMNQAAGVVDNHNKVNALNIHVFFRTLLKWLQSKVMAEPQLVPQLNFSTSNK